VRCEPLAGHIERAPEETALIMYTSGSTGRPKGVVHDFHNVAASSRGICETIGFRHDDRLISYLPLAHTFERVAIECISLYSAIHVFFAESLETFVADIQRARPTIFHSVPRLWLKFQLGVFHKVPERKLKRLLRIPILSGIVKRKILRGLGLDQTRLAVSGSAPIPPDLIQWYRDLGLELLEGYAMSENFTYSHVSLPGRSRVGFVGHALPGVEVKLGDNEEVLVKSPATMKCYHKQPELTAEAFTADGFLCTGDRGELDSEGRLRITGRVKELFKTSKGKYIAPVPIENAINASSSIEQSCVMGSGQPQPFAVVMLAEALRARPDGPALRAELEAAHARAGQRRAARPRAAAVHHRGQGPLADRERVPDADDEDQAQRPRGALRGQGRRLVRRRAAGGLGELSETAGAGERILLPMDLRLGVAAVAALALGCQGNLRGAADARGDGATLGERGPVESGSPEARTPQPDGQRRERASADAPKPKPDSAAACAPIPGASYGKLAPTNPFAGDMSKHGDVNLLLRQRQAVAKTKGLVDVGGPTDAKAPQLYSLFADDRVPQFPAVYKVQAWDWSCNCAKGWIDDPEVTLAGMGTSAGEAIQAPKSGYDIGGGHVAMVLYAAPGTITLKYTREDDVVKGYTIHLSGICPDPGLQALYDQLNAGGRKELPALKGRQPLGRALGAEIQAAIRDTGSWMDPRVRKDWWQGK
jgi:hypothetical protein